MARIPRPPLPTGIPVRRIRFQAMALMVVGAAVAIVAVLALTAGLTATTTNRVVAWVMMAWGLLSCVIGLALLAWLSRRFG